VIRVAAAMILLIVAACGDGEPLPPPTYDRPVLRADGSLTGVSGVDGRHWNLVDRNLRRGVYWYSFMDRLTKLCPVTFPEHADWLGEVNLLLQRASGHAMRQAIDMERIRLQQLVEGADRAVTGLNAMSVAEVDVAGIVRGWIRKAAGTDVTDDEGWIKGCSLLFDKESLRGLLRNSAQPLADYYDRMQNEYPEIYKGVTGVDGIVRRLNKV
jgi:hypothetical protein